MKKMIIVSVLLLVALCSYATNVREIVINGITLGEYIQICEDIQTTIRTRDMVTFEILYQDWENDTWVNTQLQTFSYDGSGYAVDVLYQMWDGTGWVDFMHVTSTNNENGWPIETIMQSWDSINQVWIEAAIITTNYDAQGHPTYSLIQMNLAGSWTNASQMTWTWDGDLMMELLTEEWDFQGGTGWINDDWELFTYDGIDEIEKLEKMWEGDETGWVDNHRTTSTYDGNHHLMEELLQGWDMVNWNNQRHSAYTYDGDGNEIEEYEREWQNGWVDFQMKTSTWENGNMTSRLVQEWNPGRNWVNHEMQSFTYGELDSPENELSSITSLTNYPNPFNPNTTISFSVGENNQLTKLEIFNVKGQLVKTLVNSPLSSGNYLIEWNGTNNIQKPVVSGIYFYRLTTDKSCQIRKMIMMK
jgi:hypothetical protein